MKLHCALSLNAAAHYFPINGVVYCKSTSKLIFCFILAELSFLLKYVKVSDTEPSHHWFPEISAQK